MTALTAVASPRALHRAARLWLVGTGLALVVLVGGLVIANVIFQRRMVRDIENDQVAAVTQQRLVDWALADHEAGLADEVGRLARSGDLKDAIIGGKREELRDQLEPPLNRLRKGPLAVIRLTLYTVDGRLRMHAQDSDDVGASEIYERRLLGVALHERRIVKGLEVLSGVPYLLAASPIYHEGKVIGFLEMGASLASVARLLHAVSGAQIGVRMTDGAVIETATPEIIREALHSAAPAAKASRHVGHNDQRPFVVTTVPLTSFSGAAVGHLVLVSDVSRSFATLRTSHAVGLVIAIVGCALAGALLVFVSRRLDRLYARLEHLHDTADELRERAERRAAGLAAVSAMTRSIASARTPGEAGSAVATAATSVLGAALTVVWLEAEEPGLLRRAFAWGTVVEGGAVPDVLMTRAGAGLVGRVFAAGMPEYRVDIQAERESLNQRFMAEAGLHAWAGLPLLARGRSFGVVAFLFKDAREFTVEEKELMLLLSDSVAIAIDRSSSELAGSRGL